VIAREVRIAGGVGSDPGVENGREGLHPRRSTPRGWSRMTS
jgi:hypothetical protein